MTMLCAECGKRMVEPRAASGRRSQFKNFPSLEIPADVEIPTCSNCGAEWIDKKTAMKLDAALAEQGEKLPVNVARKSIEALSGSINQRELETKLGLSSDYLSKVKHGKEVPSSTLVSLLALLIDRRLGPASWF